MIKIQDVQNFIKLCLPLAAAFLAQKGMQFIDTLMMGWIGPNALAAGALGTTIFMTILVFFRGMVSMVGVSIVHARGSSEASIQNIQSILHQATYLALLLSLPAMAIAWLAPNYLTVLKQNPTVVEDTRLLLHGLTWGLPGFMLFFILREFISAFALARAIMVVSLISIPLIFISDYTLIYGKYGFPTLGIAGIGYANAIVIWFMFGALLWYCSRQSVLKSYISWQLPPLHFNTLKTLASGGSATAVILVLDMIAFLAAALMIGYFGVLALAAYQIAMQCLSIAYNLPLAVAVVTTLEVGHGQATGDRQRIQETVYIGISLGLMISATLSILFMSMPHAITQLFLPNREHLEGILPTAQLFLVLASLILCFDGSQTIIIGALRGMKDTLIPMIISIICYLLIGVAGAYLLGFHTHLGASGIWYGLFVGIAALCLVAALRLRQLLRTAG